MAKSTVIVVRGRLDWPKITGDARPYTGNPKYDKGPYWSMDVTPDAASRKALKAVGIDGKLRQPGENDSREESFLTLRVLLNRPDGKKNDPPKISDINGRPWTGGLIGNGTVADVKIKVNDYGSGSDKGAYMQAVRILDLVPYEGGGFEALSEDDEYFRQSGETEEVVATGAKEPVVDTEEDEDEIPF